VKNEWDIEHSKQHATSENIVKRMKRNDRAVLPRWTAEYIAGQAHRNAALQY
jgi:hypothetical protein